MEILEPIKSNEIQNSEIMIHFDLPKEKSSILKVIGVGGGGSNAVNHMYSQNIDGVNFIICNTDAQAIAQSHVPNKIQLGPHLTQGLGAGANPQIGKQATEESLEEIKRILEVNTKMAFITAGMGGGTGTGGAPIISKICKDLGILTVGIVTTPFAYEGKKRQLQAEEGINQLKQYVDTLLVISNDKLRHQFGNLKMKDAFAKADNVLATAAKCITDVINSTGQINVDFADVCTVMRNGGVAILGSAEAEGEGRAQKAIEEALNSPLLNDNDIRGAKWILININSSEGDDEFTMDEVEVIQNYLLSHAGDETDVILGLGYDSTLGRKIGITLIATGFEHKSPFYKKEEKKPEPKKEEKILMSLNSAAGDQLSFDQPSRPLTSDNVLYENKEKSGVVVQERIKKSEIIIPEEKLSAREIALMPTLVESEPESVLHPNGTENPAAQTEGPVEKYELVFSQTNVDAQVPKEAEPPKAPGSHPDEMGRRVEQTHVSDIHYQDAKAPASAVSGGYLLKPNNIYAEARRDNDPVTKEPAPAGNPDPQPALGPIQKEDEPLFEMELVIREEVPSATDQHEAREVEPDMQPQGVGNLPLEDEVEEQRRRATERIQKLRNLSFNVNGGDSNNEFDAVPAYIRRNLELYNTVNSVENFYSNYTVKPDENNKTKISTINTFLDGKKPD